MDGSNGKVVPAIAAALQVARGRKGGKSVLIERK